MSKNYYLVTDSGKIIKFSAKDFEYLPPAMQQIFDELGNKFESKKDAELAIEKLKALRRLRKAELKFKDFNYNIDGDVYDGSVDLKGLVYPGFGDDLKIVFGGEE